MYHLTVIHISYEWRLAKLYQFIDVSKSSKWGTAKWMLFEEMYDIYMIYYASLFWRLFMHPNHLEEFHFSVLWLCYVKVFSYSSMKVYQLKNDMFVIRRIWSKSQLAKNFVMVIHVLLDTNCKVISTLSDNFLNQPIFTIKNNRTNMCIDIYMSVYLSLLGVKKFL